MDLATMVKRLRSQGIAPKAVGYARFSSINQEGNMSIQAQTRAIHEFAEKNGLSLVHEYIDRAQSATSDDREEFQKMIKDSANGEWHFVIVHKLDRFARNRVDSAGYRVKLAKNGVMLVSTLESFDPDSPEGALMEGLAELMAEFYSKNLSREIKKGQKENALAAKFCGGTPPLGYDVDPVTKKLVINEQEAEAVRLMFSMVAQNHSYIEVLNALYDRELKTKRGNDFGRNSIHDILRNPKYKGLYFYRRLPSSILGKKARNAHKYNASEDMILVDGGVPAIVTEEEFQKVQGVLDRRKNTREVHRIEKYLLAGKLYCGICGLAYYGETHKVPKTGAIYHLYRCSGTRKVKENRCSSCTVNRDLLEQRVLEYLSEIMFSPASIPKLMKKYQAQKELRNKELTVELRALRRREKEVDKRIQNILSMIEGGEGNQILLSRLDELEKQKSEIVENLSKEEEKIGTQKMDPEKLKKLFEKARELLKSGNLAATKRLIEMFVEKIVVNSDDILIRFNSTAFASQDESVMIEKKIDCNKVRIYKKHMS